MLIPAVERLLHFELSETQRMVCEERELRDPNDPMSGDGRYFWYESKGTRAGVRGPITDGEIFVGHHVSDESLLQEGHEFKDMEISLRISEVHDRDGQIRQEGSLVINGKTKDGLRIKATFSTTPPKNPFSGFMGIYNPDESRGLYHLQLGEEAITAVKPDNFQGDWEKTKQHAEEWIMYTLQVAESLIQYGQEHAQPR